MRMRVLLGLLVALCSSVTASTAPAKRAANDPKEMKAVVHAWSDKLNAGDNQGVAHLSAPGDRRPGLRVPLPHVRADRRMALVSAVRGHITSIRIKGRFATAVFRLGDRRGSPCDSPGALA